MIADICIDYIDSADTRGNTSQAVILLRPSRLRAPETWKPLKLKQKSPKHNICALVCRKSQHSHTLQNFNIFALLSSVPVSLFANQWSCQKLWEMLELKVDWSDELPDNCLSVGWRWFSRQFAWVRNVNRPQKILPGIFNRLESCKSRNGKKLQEKTWLRYEAQIA